MVGDGGIREVKDWSIRLYVGDWVGRLRIGYADRERRRRRRKGEETH